MKSIFIIFACVVSLLPLQATHAIPCAPDINIINQTEVVLKINNDAANYCNPVTDPSSGIPKKGNGSLTFTDKENTCSAMLGPGWADIIIQMKSDGTYIAKCANGYACQCNEQRLTVFPSSSGTTYCELK